MTKTGIAVVFTAVGAGIGYGIARLIHRADCSDKTIWINPNSTTKELGATYVCLGYLVTWRSDPLRLMNVEFVGMENPDTAPLPYNLNCKDFTKSVCPSGPMDPNAVKGSEALYTVKIRNGRTYNGRIIIQK